MFKSKAQIAKFGRMVKDGKISQAKFQEWLDKTPNIAKLPAHVKKGKKSAPNPLAHLNSKNYKLLTKH